MVGSWDPSSSPRVEVGDRASKIGDLCEIFSGEIGAGLIPFIYTVLMFHGPSIVFSIYTFLGR